MSDDADPNAKSRKQLPILLGIVGAVAGFIGTVVLALPSKPVDPVTSGLTALFVFGPIGAIIGAFVGAKLGTLIRPTKPPAMESPAAMSETGMPGGRRVPQTSAGTGSAGTESAGATTSNALKALGIVVGTVAVVLGGYVFYDYQTTPTPWLRPNGTELQFEVRLPAGSATPPANMKAELQTSANTMPADIMPNLFRSDGGRPVIVGEVSLAFRAGWRQIEVKIPGRASTTYQLKLATSPSHSSSLGSWQPHPDGSEIRYRVKWPGKD